MPETAATARRRLNGSVNLLQLAFVSDRVVRHDLHVEDQRLVPRRADFDPMRPGLDAQLLEHPVEVVDDARVVAVNVDRRFLWPHLQPESALVGRARAVVLRGVPAAVPTVPRIVGIVVTGVVAAVVAADAYSAKTPRIVTTKPADHHGGGWCCSSRNRLPDDRPPVARPARGGAILATRTASIRGSTGCRGAAV